MRLARAARAAMLAGGALAGVDARVASADPRGDAEALCRAGDEAAKDRRYADAVDAYHRAVATDPSAACALGARARAEDLEAHSEGGFGPLGMLDAVRRDPKKMDDRAAIEALDRAVKAFPPGRVRGEARITLAHAFVDEGDLDRARASYTEALRDTAGDRLTRALALAELWAICKKRGDVDRAYAEVERDPLLSPSMTLLIRRAHRHEVAGRLSAGVLAALGVAFAAAAVRLAVVARKARALRELVSSWVRPFMIAFALYVGGAAALLIRIRGEGDARPFLFFGLALVALLAGARAGQAALGLRRAAPRAIWALACAAGVLAAAFVSVDRVDAGYLAEIGL